MKRALPAVPLVLFIFLNACVSAGVPPETGTAVANTQTATMWTAVATASPISNDTRNELFTLLTQPSPAGFASELEKLENIIGGSYEVLNVDFQTNEGGSLIFRVMLNCKCGYKTPCCHTDRMFVYTMGKMYQSQAKIIEKMPPEVKIVTVNCLDQMSPIGEMSADWADVKNFISGTLPGSQFGVKVRP